MTEIGGCRLSFGQKNSRGRVVAYITHEVARRRTTAGADMGALSVTCIFTHTHTQTGPLIQELPSLGVGSLLNNTQPLSFYSRPDSCILRTHTPTRIPVDVSVMLRPPSAFSLQSHLHAHA